MIVENHDAFRKWLEKAVEPLCEVDPVTLTRYICALLGKDKSEKELRQSLMLQLNVFLQAETNPFVEKLFEVIQRKEYLTENPLGLQLSGEGEFSGVDKSAKSSTTSSKPVEGGKEKSGAPVVVMSEPAPTSSSSSTPITTTTASVNNSDHATNIPAAVAQAKSPNKKESPLKKVAKNMIAVTPSALLSVKASGSGNTNPPPPPVITIDSDAGVNGGNRKNSSVKRARRDDDRDKTRNRVRLDRGRRGAGGRTRSITDRLRQRLPSPRRYRRSVGIRKRSRSPPPPPIRNRSVSVSPRHKNRTPARLRLRPNISRSRSRSPPVMGSKSRSPPSTTKLKKDVSSCTPPVQSSSGLKKTAEKPVVQSVIVRPATPLGNLAELNLGYNAVSQPAPRQKCKDFNEKGLCMLGELCPFDHGFDPVVIVVSGSDGQPANNGTAGGGVIPGPPGYNAHLRPRIMGEYYPDSSAMTSSVGWVPGRPTGGPTFLPPHMMVPRGDGMMMPPAHMGPYSVPCGHTQRQLISVPMVGAPTHYSAMGEMYRPNPPLPMMPMYPRPVQGLHRMHSFQGRGVFDHGRLGVHPAYNNTNNCSLEVRKIVREQNTIADLNGYFHRFGKIVNIQINYKNDPHAALVTFSSPAEAQLAYQSPEAVLNNRFVRVFWHNKNSEQQPGPSRIPAKDRLGTLIKIPIENESKVVVSGDKITKTVYNSSLLVKKVETPQLQDKLQTVESIKKNQEMLANQVTLKNLQEQKRQEGLKMTNDLRKRQQIIMEEQIQQQKKLIAKLESGKMKREEKEETLKILKEIEDSVTKLKIDLDESDPTKLISKPAELLQTPKSRKETQKDILDAELDLFKKEQQGGETMFLQQKVLELRARARSLGLLRRRRGRGGYRGSSGRGFRGPRSMTRGRGRGMVRESRSFDRRPAKIRVMGWPSSRLPDILIHFNRFGQIRDYWVEEDSFVFDFDSRKCAEVVMAKGSVLEDVNLQLEWVTENFTWPRSGDSVSNDGAETDQESNIDEDEVDDALDNILNGEILLTGDEEEEEEEDEEDRTCWKR